MVDSSPLQAPRSQRGRLQAGLTAQLLARQVIVVPYDALRRTGIERPRIGGCHWHAKIVLLPNAALTERAGNDFGEFADFAKSKRS